MTNRIKSLWRGWIKHRDNIWESERIQAWHHRENRRAAK